MLLIQISNTGSEGLIFLTSYNVCL